MLSISASFRILIVIMMFLTFNPSVTIETSSTGTPRFTNNNNNEFTPTDTTITARTQKSIIEPQIYAVIVDYPLLETDRLSEEVKDAISNALTHWVYEYPMNGRFSILSIRWEPNWALATLTTADLYSPVPGQETSVLSGRLASLVLVNYENEWKAAVEGDPNVNDLLDLIPETELSPGAKKALFPSDLGSGGAANTINQQYDSYKFPWPSDRPWQNHGVWHGTHLQVEFPLKPFTINGHTYTDTFWYDGEELYSTNSAASSCPQSGGAILYWNADYNCDNNKGDPGYRQFLSVGTYNVNNGAFNDNASSLKVPSGWSVKLYEHTNRAGGNICYNSDINDFYNQGYFPGTNMPINDNVSSVTVYNNPSCDNNWKVEYFSDTSFTTPCSPSNLTTPGPFAFKDWGEDSPYSGCPNENWSARFSRTVHFQSGNYSFGLGSDDWSRIIVDGETVVNNWQGVGEHYKSRTYSEGDKQVTVEFADTSGQAKLAAWWWGPGVSMPRENRDPNQWYAQYWGNKDLWWDSIIRINEGTGSLDHVWDSYPGFDLPDDKFSSRFERNINFSCGKYRFNISTDDGVRFWIDNINRLDYWIDQTASYTVDVNLTEGYHELKIEHYDNVDGASLSLNWSNLAPCPPKSPTNLNAVTISSTQINLTWVDNASNEESYELERSPDGNTSWTVIANLNANATNYPDSSLNPGTTYYYRVRAHNIAGYSEYSNIATATTHSTGFTTYIPLIRK